MQNQKTYFLTFNAKAKDGASLEDIQRDYIRPFEVGERSPFKWRAKSTDIEEFDRFYILQQGLGAGDGGVGNSIIGFGEFKAKPKKETLSEKPRALIRLSYIQDPEKVGYIVSGYDVARLLPNSSEDIENAFSIQTSGSSPLKKEIVDAIDRFILENRPELWPKLNLVIHEPVQTFPNLLTTDSNIGDASEGLDKRRSPEISANSARRNKLLGNYGEDWIVRYLTERFSSSGWKFEHSSKINENLGYDIIARKERPRKTPKLIYIEIKTTVKYNETFFMSKSEYMAFQEKGRRALLICVSGIDEAPDEGAGQMFSGGAISGSFRRTMLNKMPKEIIAYRIHSKKKTT